MIEKKECDAYKCIDTKENRIRIRKNGTEKPLVSKHRLCAMEMRDHLRGFVCKITHEKLNK